MSEPIIILGEHGEFDQDDSGNIVLRNTETDVKITMSDIVEMDHIQIEDAQNVVESSVNVSISHRYFYGPDDPLDDPDVDVREGDVWYDTGELE